MHRKRVTCELHDSYFRSMTIKHAIPKTAEVTHSDGQLWGDIELAIELLYNSVKTGSQLVWRLESLERRCGGEKQHPAEGALGTPNWAIWGSEVLEKWCCRENSTQLRAGPPRPPDEQHQENGKETLMAIRVGVNMLQLCSVSNSLYTQPFQIKWEVHIFLKNCVIVIILHAYVDVYVLCLFIVGHGGDYTTLSTSPEV